MRPAFAASATSRRRVVGGIVALGTVAAGLTGSVARSHPPVAALRPAPYIAPDVTRGGSPPATLPGINLALGKPTVASSTEAFAWDAANAVDGDIRTRWGSQWNDPQWISVDLGRPWTVSAVRLWWETAHATRYAIQTSTDGVTWTVVRTVVDGDGGIDDLSFPAIQARYVMMFGTHRSSGYGYSLWEFEIR